jgi:hypothetical protein
MMRMPLTVSDRLLHPQVEIGNSTPEPINAASHLPTVEAMEPTQTAAIVLVVLLLVTYRQMRTRSATAATRLHLPTITIAPWPAQGGLLDRDHLPLSIPLLAVNW